ncbi:hypothetical protein DV736_g423, partial [Chaetothyriales sp. CBS 134916]
MSTASVTPPIEPSTLVAPVGTSLPANGFGGSWHTVDFQVPVYNHNHNPNVVKNINWYMTDQFVESTANAGSIYGVSFGVCLIVLIYVIVLTPRSKMRLPFYVFYILALVSETIRSLVDTVRVGKLGMFPYLASLSLTGDVGSTTWSTGYINLSITKQAAAILSYCFTITCLWIQAYSLLHHIRHDHSRVYWAIMGTLTGGSLVTLVFDILYANSQIRRLQKNPTRFDFNTLTSGTWMGLALSFALWSLVSSGSVIHLMYTRIRFGVRGNGVRRFSVAILLLATLDSFLAPITLCLLGLIPNRFDITKATSLVSPAVARAGRQHENPFRDPIRDPVDRELAEIDAMKTPRTSQASDDLVVGHVPDEQVLQQPHVASQTSARTSPREPGPASMSNKFNEPWSLQEKIELLVNILQVQHQHLHRDFVGFLAQTVRQNPGFSWNEVPLPSGRSVHSCQAICDAVHATPRLQQAFGPSPWIQQHPRAIQPRPSRSTDSPNPASTNGESLTIMRTTGSDLTGERRRKKRGRPTKEEAEERDRQLAAEGKVYEPKKRPAKKFRASTGTPGPASETALSPMAQQTTPLPRTSEATEESSSSSKRRSKRQASFARGEPVSPTRRAPGPSEPTGAESPSDRLFARFGERERLPPHLPAAILPGQPPAPEEAGPSTG